MGGWMYDRVWHDVGVVQHACNPTPPHRVNSRYCEVEGGRGGGGGSGGGGGKGGVCVRV